MICLAISYCAKKEKNPYILTFKFRYFPMFLCKTLLPKEINTV